MSYWHEDHDHEVVETVPAWQWDGAKALLHVVWAVVEAAGQRTAFEHDVHFHLRVENPPLLPLVIEAWNSPAVLVPGERRRIAVAHYVEIGGDLVPDPDIEMTDTGVPIALTQRPVLVMRGDQWLEADGYTRVLWRDDMTGQVWRDRRAFREISAFSRVWATNLRAQGFIAAARARAEDEVS